MKKNTKSIKNNFNISTFLENINTNKLLIGLMMIFMNIGSRFIELKFTDAQEKIIKNVAREVLIFTIAFVYTKDIVLAIIITGSFIILANYVFNEKCKYNILPKKFKKISNLIDTNGDGIISEDEIENATKILEKAQKQKVDYKKVNILESFNNMSYNK
tara:strand:- start:581 stop:1057 length:477 start_codon:yes stop_codon:yes gene_type:complete